MMALLLLIFLLSALVDSSTINQFGGDVVLEPVWIYNQTPLGNLYQSLFSKIGTRPNVYFHAIQETPHDLDFNGTYVMINGEPFNPRDYCDSQRLSKTVVLGYSLDNGVWFPMASWVYAFLQGRSPFDVHRHTIDPPYFAVYISSNCVEHREKRFDQLVEFGNKYQLGEVHALGKCYGVHPETKRSTATVSSTANAYDIAIHAYDKYKFALVVENSFLPGYVSEKITLAFLGGAIPIYSGDASVFRLYNSNRFVFISQTDTELESQLLQFMQNEQHFSDSFYSSMYQFSWHPDVQLQNNIISEINSVIHN